MASDTLMSRGQFEQISTKLIKIINQPVIMDLSNEIKRKKTHFSLFNPLSISFSYVFLMHRLDNRYLPIACTFLNDVRLMQITEVNNCAVDGVHRFSIHLHTIV